MPNNSPRHFELSELIDYVRHSGSPERLAAMREHIEVEGCERCRRSAGLLSEAYGAARSLAAVDVPSAAVQRAQAIFRSRSAAASSPAWWSHLPYLALDLVSGGAWEPAPAGLRSAAAQRQRIYSDGSIQLRLLQETDGEGQRTLVGAVTNLVDLAHAYSGCSVVVLAGEKIVTQAQTSRFGEFHLELPNQRNLRLVVLVDGETRRLDVAIED